MFKVYNNKIVNAIQMQNTCIPKPNFIYSAYL